MNIAIRRIRIHALVEAVLPHLADMPPMKRADVYEGIAEATRDTSPALHANAQRIASQLRDADLAQMQFLNLCNEERREA
ncbi:hypothetical protein [Prosthecobacter vanneervenii]|uniref:Uncharacterized protein n=1 Tax=Prosthecobacter vanneervenii TaxID=48466 RepID=A0A7W7YBI1_9BACT|nr:hypothetical protein [Prosthecobacter vanneervenii]MBB5033151.1 hypothetical protein [Prosthecobacter vanneervenii]